MCIAETREMMVTTAITCAQLRSNNNIYIMVKSLQQNLQQQEGAKQQKETAGRQRER
jgi:hypothetical protein